MEVGIDSFAAILRDPTTGIEISPAERLSNLLEEVETADRVGIDIFGVGEHHRSEFLDSAPAIILAAVAARTQNIRCQSAWKRDPGSARNRDPSAGGVMTWS